MKLRARLEGGELLKAELKARERRYAAYHVEVGLMDAKNAYKAHIQEFGRPEKSIPQRPFLSMARSIHRKEWLNILVQMIRQGAKSKEAMTEVGKYMKENVKEAIKSPWLYERNAAATVRKKGFDFPLVETEKMYQAVRYKVIRGVKQ